jgi:hypothetical protein
MRLSLILENWKLAICQLPPDREVPPWALGGPFCSVTRTPTEVSVVCLESQVPEGVRLATGWRCLAVEGPLPFELTGALASLATPLARAGVSLFSISTFDTDYLLVREPDVRKAVDALQSHGHRVAG